MRECDAQRTTKIARDPGGGGGQHLPGDPARRRGGPGGSRIRLQLLDRDELAADPVAAFVSLPGHFEGANRLITFTFYKTGIDPFGDIRFRATASGPWTLNAYLTIQSGQAFNFWNTFATNVGRAYG
ncbi:hypothetical protein [Paractinoplanes rishiriensis]|uniref:Uncharacterized protein n=1 Tax=Paractinoplanes rishiriensis TaxID=1050105 RepID=A0A919K785_9ACTN|nr:hypothetical protein [Actinoplanes rishiriensis]GIE99798.1 hypothetical protein Ari01nite_72630 [Actinoplanes rishiriensis]